MSERKRAAEITLVLDAPIENVWNALTDARELTRWFPLQADAQSEVGATVAWRWDDHFSMVSRVDGCEPPRLLRLVQDRERPHDADGASLPNESTARVVMEFTLETLQGQTRLRLVHSGFGSGDAWDDELEGVTNGWNYELRVLAHYLAHHRGRDRHFGWAWTTTSRTAADVWEALTGASGMALPPSARDVGSPYTLTTPDGVILSGTSRLHVPGREWFATAAELDNGIVRLSTWSGGGRTGVTVGFATWSPDRAALATSLGRSAQRFLDRQLARHELQPSSSGGHP
jgi:uncharacterized protein YndB with AHSA1/START domain